MKRTVLLLFFVFAVLIIVYRLPVHSSIEIRQALPVSQQTAYRAFTQPFLFPAHLRDSSGPLSLNRVEPRMFNEALVMFGQEETVIPGLVRFLGVGDDSTTVVWQLRRATSSTPWGRLQAFFSGQRTKGALETTAERFRRFATDLRTVYGMSIERQKVSDTFLLSTRRVLKHEPSVQDYYALITALEETVKKSGAQTVNYPMLNVQPLDSGNFEVRVALPVNKVVQGSGDIVFKRMVPGYLLVAEVSGGPAAVAQAFRRMEQFMSDQRLHSPAIPYQSLVTDRRTATDTSGWKTVLHFPVM